MYASVGEALSIIFNILKDETLSALHSLSMESLFTIFKSTSTNGSDNMKLVIKKINYLVTNGSPSVPIFLTNISSILTILG